MKKIILFIIVLLLMVSLVSSTNHIPKKPKINKDTISDINESKLKDHYKFRFKKVKEFHTYEKKGDVTVINVSMEDGSYARLLTKTDVEELLK